MLHYNYIGKIQFTRATTAERLAAVPMLSEPVWDETLKQLYIGDGVTAGGIPVSTDTSVIEQEIANLQIALNNEIQARIDGDTQLAEDLQNEITARSVAIQDLLNSLANEASERIAADNALQQSINNEITDVNDRIDGVQSDLATETAARIAADTALGVRIDELTTDTSSSLATEIQARIDGDAALQSDIDAEVLARTNADTALGGRIDDETTARIAADTTLQTNINSEASTRESADTALGVRIDNETAARITKDNELAASIEEIEDNLSIETQARIDGDAALQNQIDTTTNSIATETQARIDGDAALQTNINNEASTRESADTALGVRIDNETAARIAGDNAQASSLADAVSDLEAADTTLQTNINTETTARTAGDAALGVRVDGVVSDLADETTARTSADTTLQSNIDAEVLARTNADTALGVRIDNETAARIAGDNALQTNIDLKANTADLSVVATTGSYNDLLDKPTIAGQVNSDWNATSGVEEILNKPTTLDGYGITDAINVSQKGANNGVATLGSDGKIPAAQIPAIALGEVYEVDSEAAMLALDAQSGDMAIRTDILANFIHNNGTSGTITDWTQLLTPPNAVLSVNGQTGVVVLDKGDVGLGNVDNTSDLNKPISTATQTALDGKVDDFTAQTTNTVFAAPNGSTGLPVFRSLVVADIPSLSSLYVVNGRTVTAGTGLTGGGSLAADRTIALSSESIASLALADTAVQPSSLAPVATAGTFASLTAKPTTLAGYGITDAVPTSRTVNTGTGLKGGGNLSTNRTLELADDAVASLLKANTSLQPENIGTDVQAYSANLTSWSALAPSSKVSTGAITASGLTMATSRILGRSTAGTGAVEELTIGSGLTLSGGVLSASSSGSVTSVSAGNGMSFTTITGTGSVTLGTPSTLTASTSNAVTANSHTHQITGFLALTGGTMTGAIIGPNGSVTNASYAVRAANYGMYSSAVNDLDFTVNGSRVLNLERGETNATNYFKFINNAVTDANYGPDIVVDGTQANISMFLGAKGNGRIVFGNGNNSEAVSVTSANNGWSGINIAGTGASLQLESASNNGVFIYATGGTTADVDVGISGKGSGGVMLRNSNLQGIYATGSTTASQISVLHSETNANLELSAKGTGVVNVLSTLQQNGSNVLTNAAIGTSVQAYNANLTAWAAITTSSKADSSVTMTAGNGLSGGGSLDANRTFTLGTPSTLTASTTNAVTTTSHTHQITGFLALTGGALTGGLTGTTATFSGAVVAPLGFNNFNSSATLTTTHLNSVVRKTNTTAYTYTIPSALGKDGDAITINNIGTSGDITVVAGSGVTLYVSGTAGNLVLGPHRSATIIRESSTVWSVY